MCVDNEKGKRVGGNAELLQKEQTTDTDIHPQTQLRLEATKY